MWKIAQIKV